MFSKLSIRFFITFFAFALSKELLLLVEHLHSHDRDTNNHNITIETGISNLGFSS